MYDEKKSSIQLLLATKKKILSYGLELCHYLLGINMSRDTVSYGFSSNSVHPNIYIIL